MDMMATETPSAPESEDDGAPSGRTRRLRLPTPPLWLFGLLEAVQAVLATMLLVVLPVLAMTLGGGFAAADAEFIASLSAQIWLILHGTPVELVVTLPDGALGEGLEIPEGGWFHLLPMGLTLIPAALGWRAGRRLAQGSYTYQLWQGLLTLVLGYAAAGVGFSQLATADSFQVETHWAGLCAALVMGLASLGGCYAEARSWTRLIGVDLEAKVEELSQRLRWAGYYAWAVLRAAVVACVAAVGLSAALLAGRLAFSWMEMVNIFQRLDPGVWGILGLTLLHVGLVPNLVLWTLAYSTGAGFSVGSGSTVAPHAVELGAVPAVPVLGALPGEPGEAGLAVLLLPVLAGVAAGWWFMREGENHLDDWFALRIPLRPVSLTLSTLSLGVLIGAAAGLLALGPLWLSHISLGVGRMTDVGPDALVAAGMLGLWTALGSIVGYLIAPAAHQVRIRRVEPPQPADDVADGLGAGAEGSLERPGPERDSPGSAGSPGSPDSPGRGVGLSRAGRVSRASTEDAGLAEGGSGDGSSGEGGSEESEDASSSAADRGIDEAAGVTPLFGDRPARSPRPRPPSQPKPKSSPARPLRRD